MSEKAKIFFGAIGIAVAFIAFSFINEFIKDAKKAVVKKVFAPSINWDKKIENDVLTATRIINKNFVADMNNNTSQKLETRKDINKLAEYFADYPDDKKELALELTRKHTQYFASSLNDTIKNLAKGKKMNRQSKETQKLYSSLASYPQIKKEIKEYHRLMKNVLKKSTAISKTKTILRLKRLKSFFQEQAPNDFEEIFGVKF